MIITLKTTNFNRKILLNKYKEKGIISINCETKFEIIQYIDLYITVKNSINKILTKCRLKQQS